MLNLGVRLIISMPQRAKWSAKVLVVAAAVMGGALASAAHAAQIYAITDNNRLLTFDSGSPGVLTGVGPITGRIGNEDLIGIDFRPSDNVLFAVGEFGNIYTINTTTAAATSIGGGLTVPLQGSRFGLDFVPTNNLLRITSDTNQNLITSVSGIVTVQTALAYAAGDPNFGQDPNVVGIAYSNNVSGAGSTTLYGIDSSAGAHRLVTINPPAAGQLHTVGPLGFAHSSLVGFDIFTGGQGDIGYAALQDESLGISQLFSINLVTGNATLIGTIGGGDLIDGIAVVIPEPTALSLLAIGALGLIRRR